MRYSYFFLESLVLLIVISCLLLCSCRSISVIPDSEYDRYIREKKYDEQNKDFYDRTPHPHFKK